jgi:hypothetical protein
MVSRQAPRFRSRLTRQVLRRVGWLIGAPLAVFRFLRRRVTIEEIDPQGDRAPLPADGEERAAHGVQGSGSVVHRLYSTRIEAATLSAERLVSVIAADPNVIAPTEVLRFEKTRGRPGRLEEGDRLLIRMAGPWNAPVEVTRRWAQGFRLAAARGHPQLGQFELRARDEHGAIAIEIQTRERGAARGFQLLQRVKLIQRMQDYTWGEMLQNTARLAGGRPPERITVQPLRTHGDR